MGEGRLLDMPNLVAFYWDRSTIRSVETHELYREYHERSREAGTLFTRIGGPARRKGSDADSDWSEESA